MLGAVGFGVAVLFVMQGAPDLALTQMLVETLALAVFVLVLRRLPEDFEQHLWRFGQGLRLALSVGVGLFVGAIALLAAAARTRDTAAAEFLARAEPEGGGRNVVNVILTDFRALDTFGEITVLLVAAIGIILLVRTPVTDDGDDA
jgi:multicomponent Na+:H+ antiporter subunit A